MSAEQDSHPTRHTFQRTARLLDDFFKVDEYKGAYQRFDGQMSAERRLLVFERGDSVAALLFDPNHREVILVEQFRLPVVGKRDGDGWLLEPAAGMVREGESPQESMIRELQEETGYHVRRLEPVGSFFVSPGGTSERIHLFYAEVRRTHKIDAGGGVGRDGEDIRIVRMPVTEFFVRMFNRGFEDAKLMIAALWFKERLNAMPVMEARRSDPVERKVRSLAAKPGTPPAKIIGYMTGDIMNVEDVDVWVNPLDTDMLPDRFHDHTISARIRKFAARRDPETGRIARDTIVDELRTAMNGRTYVKPAKVIETSSGELKNARGVKRIFHVATSRGAMGEAYSVDLATIESCVDNVLEAVESAGKYKSIVFPMLGTGASGFPINEVAPRLLKRAITFFQNRPRARLDKIYFLPYSEVDAAIFGNALSLVEGLE